MTKWRIKPTHEAADAFWRYWKENGETHRHGYYESTWGAINAALAVAGTVNVGDTQQNTIPLPYYYGLARRKGLAQS